MTHTRSGSRRCTVVICDDQPQLREALNDVLSSEPHFEVTGLAGDGAGCLELLRSATPDVVVMDVHMPGGGPDLVHAVRALDPTPYVLVLSAHANEHTRASMLAAGADVYLVKTGRLRPLVEALLVACRADHGPLASEHQGQ